MTLVYVRITTLNERNIMPIYNFGVNIKVEGEDYNDALYNYNQINNLFGIVDTDCFEIEEIA